MAGKVAASEPELAFEYELYEGDPDNLRTVVVSPAQSTPWIEPASLRLRHRIGRGPFGDVWLATHHQSSEDYEQFHEVVVKMLHPVKEDNLKIMFDQLNKVLLKCQGIRGVCLLYGLSIISGKICIVMKFYEGSVGDKMARLKGGKFSLPDVLRYGINLAQGIQELHSKGILILNLKPCNFLVDEHDQAVVGDIGIPLLMLGIPLPSSATTHRLGTPNYMAPEQWQPEIRGPISLETDSWGFACSIVEMLTGIPPWSGISADGICNSVVGKHERPQIPTGLPPTVENVLLGCFEYDFRNRPLMKDIIMAFKSAQNADFVEAERREVGSRSILGKINSIGYTEWFVSKDRLQVADTVRSRKTLNSSKPENMVIPEGTIVGVDNQDEFVLVRVHGIHDPLRVKPSTLERVSHGLAAGDWVRVNEKRVGILHSIDRDGTVRVGLIGMDKLWKGKSSDLQMAETYCVGQFVRLKPNVVSPRFNWARRSDGSWCTGRISWVHPNGALQVNFPGLLTLGDEPDSFLADPWEVEVVSFGSCGGIVKKYRHLEDFHWSVRPLVTAAGVFAAVKVGSCIFKGGGQSRKDGKRDNNLDCKEKKSEGGAAAAGEVKLGGWLGLHPAVAALLRGATA